jgi:hypothetical protein
MAQVENHQCVHRSMRSDADSRALCRFYSSLDHVQAVLLQRLNNTPSNSQPVATYDATRLWAGSKNKLLAHIASRSLKSRALQESPALNIVPRTSVAKAEAAPSAGTAASPPPAASAPLPVKADPAAAVPWQNEPQLHVPAVSNAPRAPFVDFWRHHRMTRFRRG